MSDAPAASAPEWYLRWVADYAASFGTADDLTGVMVRVWWPAFAAAGFVERDFAAALPQLVTAGAVPNWPREHLAAVNRELRAARDRRVRRTAAPTAPEGARCPWCAWTGWVEVPHPSCVAGGTWNPPYALGCVACTRCGPGTRAATHNAERTDPPMTLDHYELRIDPAWREHLAERREAERLMLRAVAETEGVRAARAVPSVARLAAGMIPPTERRPERRAAS